MLPENKRFADFLGITKFGGTGKGVTIGWGEDFITYSGEDDHASQSYRVLREFLPDAKIIYLPMASGSFGETVQSDFVDIAIPEIMKQKVCLMGASLAPASVDGKIFNEPLAPTLPFCTCFMSTGNNGEDSYNTMLESDYIYGVGAYRLMAGDNQIAPMSYSGVTDKVDFCAPTYVWIPSVDGKYSYQFSGTSCALPMLIVEAALVQERFIAWTGKPLSSQMLHQFLQGIAVDAGETGKDTKCGWGAPILPPPESIDIEKYREWSIMGFDDVEKISDWAKEDVEYAVNLGLMNGDGSVFNPKEPVTREQLAAVIARLHRKLAGE